jgi:hypothetical protein
MTEVDADLRARREAVILKHIKAVWSGDVEAFEATYLPGRMCYDFPLIGRTLSNDETRAEIMKGGSRMAEREVVFQRFHHCDDTVFVESRLRFKVRDQDGVLRDDTPKETMNLTIYRFEGDLLWQKSLYTDPQIATLLPKPPATP